MPAGSGWSVAKWSSWISVGIPSMEYYSSMIGRMQSDRLNGANLRQHVMRPCGKLRAVTLREFFLENFAGDLEYNPRRAGLYLSLAVAALCFWIFSAPEVKFTAIPLIFGLASLTLLLKGIFLLRKSSEGLGLTPSELADLSDSSNRKNLPSIPNQAAQIIQDFGVGPLLLWPVLNAAKDTHHTSVNPPRVSGALTGAVLFAVGWLIRRVTSARPEHS